MDAMPTADDEDDRVFGTLRVQGNKVRFVLSEVIYLSEITTWGKKAKALTSNKYSNIYWPDLEINLKCGC